MNKCNSCGIFIIEDVRYCPLCHTVTKSDDIIAEVKNPYPNIKGKRRQFSLFLRILLFICFAVTLICGFINYNLGFKPPWFIIVGSSLFYFYYLFWLLSNTYAGYLKRIFRAIISTVAFLIIIDAVLGFSRWSINYVIPTAIFLLSLALIILMIINRRNWQSYMMYQAIFILVAGLLLIPIKLGLVTKPIMTELAFITCIIVFLGTLIIGGKGASTELKRRFHI